MTSGINPSASSWIASKVDTLHLVARLEPSIFGNESKTRVRGNSWAKRAIHLNVTYIKPKHKSTSREVHL